MTSPRSNANVRFLPVTATNAHTHTHTHAHAHSHAHAHAHSHSHAHAHAHAHAHSHAHAHAHTCKCRFHPVLCSYLGYPRIHFAGKYYADTNAGNNDQCNYRMDGEIQTRPTVHSYGSNSFRFYDAMVTAVVDKHGRYQNDDFLIGKHIASNIDRSQAKIVNMDVDAQMFSSIYGMNFGIVSDDKYLVSGNWTRSVVVQNWWQRTGCFKDVDNCSTRYAGTGEALGQRNSPTSSGVMILLSWVPAPSCIN